jgi:phage-related protein
VNRKIIIYGDYFDNFYLSLDQDIQDKIDWVFQMVKTVDHIPKKFFQHLESTDGVYEIRVEFESNIYRILCFLDEGYLVVLINTFQKKSQKTPKAEIDLAKKLKKQYFIDKKLKAENEKSSRKNIKK